LFRLSEPVQDLFVPALLSTILLDFWCGGRSLADARQGRQGKKTVKFAKMAGAKRF
jgi:hypothetical protein